MELKLSRETLCFERLVNRGGEQVTIEGEATLPGSMRDAVTVLSVQAQAHLTDVQAGMGEAGVRGQVLFQVLYTQGDLTRIRAIETSCDFQHVTPLEGVTPVMRVTACACVQETQGSAASGRMKLSALLEIHLEAFETIEKTLITDVQGGDALQKKLQHADFCTTQTLGSGTATVHGEFDLLQKHGAGGVLSATAFASAGDIAGGSGRLSVSGAVQVYVLHRAQESGEPFSVTEHEIPYDVSIDAKLPEGAQLRAQAEVLDVMADCPDGGERRMLRAEARVRVTLTACMKRSADLLEDLYSLSGPVPEPQTEEIEVHVSEAHAAARESARIQMLLPPDAPPVETPLAAFVQPNITQASPSGRRLHTEGIMNVTLVYLPVDSNIPVSVHTREPFDMVFAVEAQEGVFVRAYPIETAVGPATSDRVEIRCMLGLDAVQHGTQTIRAVHAVAMRPQEKEEHGFVLVWPAPGESRWETARRLRVAQERLAPAGKNALLAFRR